MNRKLLSLPVIIGIAAVLMVVVFIVAGWAGMQKGAADTAQNATKESYEEQQVNLFCVEVQRAEDVRRAVGSGLVYQVSEDVVWIATAAHVLEDKAAADEIVLKYDDRELICERWMVDKETDLSFLKISKQEAEALGLFCKAISTDKTGYDALTEGMPVVARGYLAGSLTEYSGTLEEPWIYVEDFAQYMMVARCEVRQGMSGGGLYDSEGYFIGMICGGNEEGELVAVPWHVMQARFEELCGED